MLNRALPKVILFIVYIFLITTTPTSQANEIKCRNDTSVLSKVLGLFDGLEECKNVTKLEPIILNNNNTNNRDGTVTQLNAVGGGGRQVSGSGQYNLTEIYILNHPEKRPTNLTRADTEDLIIYPSIDEFCDTTGTQPEKQRCCPVGQWLDKDGTCRSLIH